MRPHPREDKASGLDGWLGFVALVLSVGVIPLAWAASAVHQTTLALAGAIIAIALFAAAGLLLHHSEVHHGHPFFDR